LEEVSLKVLSMIQPWALLFVLGESQFETRTWRTHYRGPLAIHTSQKFDKSVVEHKAIQFLLHKHGYTTETLPTGMIIGKVELINCLKVVENHQTWAILEDGRMVADNEYFLGDYRVGNYAWEVKNREMLDHFIPAKGKLGLWEHE
jgi:activating signal cointegrator 1